MRLKKFLYKARKIILTHIEDEDFNVGKLAEYLHLSRSQTLRKIKAATGYSANEYIREVRLQKSLELLKEENLTISEISYKVGFNNPSYFNKCFHDKFHYAPGEYRKEFLLENNVSNKFVKLKVKTFIYAGIIIVVGILIVWYLHMEVFQ